jgi:protein TonB
MRLGLIVSLLVHSGVAAAAWFLSAPQPEVRGAVAGAFLDMAPRVLPEPPAPPPAELAPPAAASELVEVVPADDMPEEPIGTPEAAARVPRPFRLRAVTKLTTPLPVRRVVPAPPAPAPLPATKPATRRREREGRLVAPRLIDAPPARYPSRARRLGWEGRVILEIVVTARGTVDKVTVEASSGRDVLDRAAAEAARRWTFRPATRDGKPVAHTVRVPVEFTLLP